MKIAGLQTSSTFLLVFCSIFSSAGPAFAGLAVPAPLAGALGPVGLIGAGVAYLGYRIVKHIRNR